MLKLFSETLDVYKIPLEYVYYNDKNGRIKFSSVFSLI